MKHIFYLFMSLLVMPLPTSGQSTPRPITLEEGLRLAAMHNETLLIAQEDLENARQQVREATADVFPQLNASLQYTRNWLLPSFLLETPEGPQQFTVGAHNNITGSIGIRQKIYSGGKTFAALKIARLFRQASEEALRQARQQVHAEVETAFYDLLWAEERARLNRRAVERARANQRRVDNLRQAGRASDYDLLRAQVQVAELLPDSIQAEHGVDLAALTFKNLVGLDPNQPIEAAGHFREQTPLAVDTSDLVALGLYARPDIRQQNLEVEIRHKSETVFQAESRPSLELLVNGQWEAQRNNFDFSTDDVQQSWFSGLTLSFPIFDGFRTGAQVAQARTQARKAELARRQTERAIRLSVLQAQKRLQEIRLRKAAQSQAIELANRGLRIAESRFANGLGTQLEMIDAQLTLHRAEAEYAQAARDLAVALVELERQTGVLGEDATLLQQEMP